MSRTERDIISPGSVIRRHSTDEVRALVQTWLETFGKRRLGANTRSYLWHVFSYECYPSISGEAALAAYGLRTAPEYTVLSNDRDIAFVTDERPVSSSLRDYLVFPPNLAWTMAFTHEDGWLGPYFARHPDFDRRDRENVAAVEHALRKRQQIEVARRNGWM